MLAQKEVFEIIDNRDYVAVRFNLPEYERETTFLECKWKPTKYAMFLYAVHKDQSEQTVIIIYSDDLEDLQKRAEQHKSWYNYPLNLCKNSNGIKHINEIR